MAGLVALALLLNLATTLYGAGIALRLQSIGRGHADLDSQSS